METQPAPAHNVGAIVPAFKLGSTRFYEFVNPEMAPCQRVFETMIELECVSMRFTRAQLEAHFEMTDQFLAGNVSRETFVKHLVECYDRLTWASAPETVFRAMACWFFTKNESPYVVDAEYNKVKIKMFIEHAKHFPDVFFSSVNSTRFPLSLEPNTLVFSKMEKSLQWMKELSSVLNLPETHSLNVELNTICPSKSRWTNIFTGWHLN